MSGANYVRCDRLFDDWQDDVLHGEPPRRYDIGPGLDHVRLGPGSVSLIGGAPGMGKTAFVMQGVVSAMRSDASLRVCVAECRDAAGTAVRTSTEPPLGRPARRHPRTTTDRQATRPDRGCV